MIHLQDINYKPSIHEIDKYIENPVFDQFFQYMNDEYKALCKIDYSKDVWYPGWNIKLRKAGKSLCTIYPRQHYFTVLVVVGRKEKEEVENLLPDFTKQMQDIYNTTKEGMGQRWLMINIHSDDDLYGDMLKLIHIRRTCK